MSLPGVPTIEQSYHPGDAHHERPTKEDQESQSQERNYPSHEQHDVTHQGTRSLYSGSSALGEDSESLSSVTLTSLHWANCTAQVSTLWAAGQCGHDRNT